MKGRAYQPARNRSRKNRAPHHPVRNLHATTKSPLAPLGRRRKFPPMTDAQAATATTFSDTESALLALYLDPHTHLHAICTELDLTYSQLERALSRPHIQEAIARAERMHTQRAHTLARCQADAATASLADLATDPNANPETRRKAATQIVRTKTTPVRKRTRSPPNSRQSHLSRARPKEKQRPHKIPKVDVPAPIQIAPEPGLLIPELEQHRDKVGEVDGAVVVAVAEAGAVGPA